MEKLLLTVPEVAELLSLSRARVYELMAFGGDDPLPSLRIGRSRRVRPDELKAWVRRQDSLPALSAHESAHYPLSPRQ
jgi:excisionase family DNA binding protein